MVVWRIELHYIVLYMYRKLRWRGKEIQTQVHDQLLDSDNDSLDSDPGVCTRTEQSERTHLAIKQYVLPSVRTTFLLLLYQFRFYFPVGSHNCPSRILLVREAFGFGRPSFRFKYLRSDSPPLYRAQKRGSAAK